VDLELSVRLESVVEGVLADQHRRGFEVDAFVLDAHDDRPPGILPANRQRQWCRVDAVVDQRVIARELRERGQIVAPQRIT